MRHAVEYVDQLADSLGKFSAIAVAEIRLDFKGSEETFVGTTSAGNLSITGTLFQGHESRSALTPWLDPRGPQRYGPSKMMRSRCYVVCFASSQLFVWLGPSYDRRFENEGLRCAVFN